MIELSGEYHEDVNRLMAEVDSLTREAERQYTTIEAYRKNSERYEWLRDYHIGDDPESINLDSATKPGLDAAIDAAK